MYIKGGERERERVSKWNLLPPCKEWRASLIYALAGLWSPAGVWAAGSKEKEKKKKKEQKHSNLYLDINSWIFFFFFSGRSVCNERCHGAEIHRQHIQCFLLYSVERERERGGGLLSCSSEQTHRGGGPFQFHDGGGGGGQASSREEDGKSS